MEGLEPPLGEGNPLSASKGSCFVNSTRELKRSTRRSYQMDQRNTRGVYLLGTAKTEGHDEPVGDSSEDINKGEEYEGEVVPQEALGGEQSDTEKEQGVR